MTELAASRWGRVLSVIFATRDRAETLREVLECYRRLDAPSGGWRLIVVDNGSRDETADVVNAFVHQLPLLGLTEPKPGKNNAINAALGYASGDLVVFTDDDVFPRSDWLVRLRAAADLHEDVTIFGGTIVPRWEVPPPDWITTLVPAAATFAVNNDISTEGPTDGRFIFGPNMAIRASAFKEGVRFDPSIGPRGTSYAMGSETELLVRLREQGHRAWFVSDAVVEHLIRKEQLTARWILRRAVRLGRGQRRLYWHREPAGIVKWRGVPRYLYRKLIESSVRVAGAVLQRDSGALFKAQWDLRYYWGQIAESKIMYFEAASRGGSEGLVEAQSVNRSKPAGS